MNAALRDALKALRLSGLAESLDVRLQEAASSRLNHAEFLELILEDELAVRRDRKVARRIKAAAFRDPKTLEDFDWDLHLGQEETDLRSVQRRLPAAKP